MLILESQQNNPSLQPKNLTVHDAGLPKKSNLQQIDHERWLSLIKVDLIKTFGMDWEGNGSNFRNRF